MTAWLRVAIMAVTNALAAIVAGSVLASPTIPAAYNQVAKEYAISAEDLYAAGLQASSAKLNNGERRPWPWTLTVAGKRYYYVNRQQTYQALQFYIDTGRRPIAIGLLQLDWATHYAALKTTWAALDPLHNLRIGAALLSRAKIVDKDVAPMPAAALPFAINRHNQQTWAATIAHVASRYQLEPELLHAVISAESAFEPRATSPAGAQGLMQLMPATARRFAVTDAYNPAQNIAGGARYLRVLLDQFDNLRLALAAYNAGENTVVKYGYRVPPYRETQQYIPRVLAFYRYFKMQGLSG